MGAVPGRQSALGRVLIVEDDPEWMDLLRRRLRAAGYETFPCARPADLLARAREFRPDCILLDSAGASPQSDLVRREVRQLQILDRLPVIVHSAHAEKNIEALKAGADYFISKDSGEAELLATLAACLRRRSWNMGVLEKGDLRLEPESRSVYWKGEPAAVLSEEQVKILQLLLAASPNPVPWEWIWSAMEGRESAPSRLHLLEHKIANMAARLPPEIASRVKATWSLGWTYQP